MYLRLFLSRLATSAHRGTIPLRVLLTTNATAFAATSLSPIADVRSGSDPADHKYKHPSATYSKWCSISFLVFQQLRAALLTCCMFYIAISTRHYGYSNFLIVHNSWSFRFPANIKWTILGGYTEFIDYLNGQQIVYNQISRWAVRVRKKRWCADISVFSVLYHYS